jgi:hypothetical protein
MFFFLTSTASLGIKSPTPSEQIGCMFFLVSAYLHDLMMMVMLMLMITRTIVVVSRSVDFRHGQNIGIAANVFKLYWLLPNLANGSLGTNLTCFRN